MKLLVSMQGDRKGQEGTGRELSHLEVWDGVCSWKPGGARVLLGTEGPVEGAGDGAQVEGTDRRRRDAVALQGDGDERDVKDGTTGSREGWTETEEDKGIHLSVRDSQVTKLLNEDSVTLTIRIL